MTTEKAIKIKLIRQSNSRIKEVAVNQSSKMDKPHGLLVSVSSMCYHTSTPDLSTLWSTTNLKMAYTMGNLILEWASRLDAFSGYPFRS